MARNSRASNGQLRTVLELWGRTRPVINNFDWMCEFSYLDFLRDVGKPCPVNMVLGQKDSLKAA